MPENPLQSEALQYLYDRYIGNDPERVASYQRAMDNARVAIYVYELRTEAGLSYRELAGLVATTASVIRDLEEADFNGDSLAMLHRIAEVLGSSVLGDSVDPTSNPSPLNP